MILLLIYQDFARTKKAKFLKNLRISVFSSILKKNFHSLTIAQDYSYDQ